MLNGIGTQKPEHQQMDCPEPMSPLAEWLQSLSIEVFSMQKVNEINKFYKELRSEFLYGIEMLKEALPWKHM